MLLGAIVLRRRNIFPCSKTCFILKIMYDLCFTVVNMKFSTKAVIFVNMPNLNVLLDP